MLSLFYKSLFISFDSALVCKETKEIRDMQCILVPIVYASIGLIKVYSSRNKYFLLKSYFLNFWDAALTPFRRQFE